MPAQRPHLTAAHAVDAGAVELDGALALDQPQQRQAERGLAGAALADDADRVALADLERNAVDRLHVIDHAPQQAGLDREPDFEIVAAHHGRRVQRGLHGMALGLGLQEALGVFMLRIVEDLRGRPMLDDQPLRHHVHPRRHLAHDAKIVGYQQQRHAQPGLYVLQQLQELSLDRHIDGGRRFVGDEKIGIVCERHGDHHALALPARQLSG
jgi:hypothetical protein